MSGKKNKLLRFARNDGCLMCFRLLGAWLTLKFKGDWLSFNDGLYLPVSIEYFQNLKGTEQFNDVVRGGPGIGYEFSELWKVEFDLSYHYTKNTVEDNFATNDFVFRFRLFHKLH
ncbi:hypothetical protein N9164_12930 [Draconibacterium sp.]|nr:hypothetical protein [Draconibacterium sp.]